MKMNTKNIAIALFILGLVIRIITIPMHHSTDVDSWVNWGKNTYEKGLAVSFQGAYFPVQYLIFTSAYIVSQYVPLETSSVIKIYNLIFEIALLGLMIYLTRKHVRPWVLMFVFWLNPFSLILFEQGYADAQIVFFVLLASAIILRYTGRFKYIIAGIPLGIAFLMKPQPTAIFIGLILFMALFIVRRKFNVIKIAGIFVFPTIFFLAFSLYFGLNIEMEGHKTLPKISIALNEKIGVPKPASDLIAKSAWLAANYAYVPKIMAAMNAYMPNAWFFIAEPRRPDNVNIYRVHDTEKLIGITYRTWGLLLFVGALALIINRIRKTDESLDWKVVMTMFIVPILTPYITTNAHENHFYYGFVSMIVMAALMSDKFLMHMSYLLGTLNGVNILYLFILPYYVNVNLNTFYPTPMRVPIMAASSLIFFVVLYYLIFRAKYVNRPFEVSTVQTTPTTLAK